MTSISNWLWGCGVLASFFLTIWLWNRYHDARRAASQTQNDVRQVRRWQQDIERARQRPRMASASRETQDSVARQVNNALTQAEVDARKLLAIDPQPAIRVPRSDYEEALTLIRLRNLTLKEILSLCDRLTIPEEGMNVRDLSLTPAQNGAISGTFPSERRNASLGDANPERWDVRMTLTRLIFSPISRS